MPDNTNELFDLNVLIPAILSLIALGTTIYSTVISPLLKKHAKTIKSAETLETLEERVDKIEKDISEIKNINLEIRRVVERTELHSKIIWTFFEVHRKIQDTLPITPQTEATIREIKSLLDKGVYQLVQFGERI